jgi:arylsulfatase A
VLFPLDTTGLHPDEVTIADMLKSAGYATACVGKWHLGHREPFLPTRQGFDSYYGIPYSNDMSHPDNKQRPPYGKWDDYWPDQAASVQRWHTPLMEDEEIIEIPVDQRTITRRYTDRAIEFVTRHRDKPFFLYLAHSMPHVPLYVPDDVHDADSNRAYEITIEHIDAETGRLLNALREQGLDENTYVIFTSDNGPWLRMKHHGGSAKPLSGGKGWFQEGGIRVPCVMWGPGRIPAGTRTDEMAATIDLLPTLAALAGVQPKTRGPIDGLDLSALVLGQGASARTELLYYSGERQGKGPYEAKLYGMRQGDWKILGRDLDNNPALHNLADDLGEQHNLARKHPEKLASMLARVRELDAELTAQTRTFGEMDSTPNTQ